MPYTSTGLELYHLPETFFGPKASIRMKRVCPGVNSCPENVSGTAAFLQSFRFRFEKNIANDALADGASYYIRRRSYGLEFGVRGFSDTIYSLTIVTTASFHSMYDAKITASAHLAKPFEKRLFETVKSSLYLGKPLPGIHF
jgi:secreted Zn-dependent insulinase-like peptidase